MNYHSRVTIVNTSGFPVRHVPAAFAHALVAAGSAAPNPSAGRIREVRLTKPASAYAERTGEATGNALGGTRFTRWVRLDQSGTRVIEHHPRALYDPRGIG